MKHIDKYISNIKLLGYHLQLIVFLIVCGPCTALERKPITTDWVFIYYMPYDNNLSQYGKEIIQMIKDSITSNKVVATVQADFDDTTGMTRYVITKEGIHITHINNEYSARTKSYEEYLQWVESNIRYKKKAIIFLDHGGKLDELCMDENPEFDFLKVDSLKQVFKKIYPRNKIDLLFLQVCFKGAIEPVFEFREVASYTLCSQLPLGAPNYYYHALFSHLSTKTVTTGLEVAKIIVEHERDDMHNSYTIVDNSKLKDFYIQLTAYKDALSEQHCFHLSTQPLVYTYYGQKYWDLISFLENTDTKSDENLRSMKETLISYIKTQLLVLVKLNPEVSEVKGSSGLSLYARGKDDNRKEYKHLDFNAAFPTLIEIEAIKPN